MDNKAFFETLFDANEHTSFAKFHNGTKVYPVKDHANALKWANYFCINPLHPTKDFAPTEEYHSEDKPRRCDKNVIVYRNILIEMDSISLREQLDLVRSKNMPYTTAVYSGGKSVHFIISLKEPLTSESAYRKLVERVQKALNGAADRANKNPSRFSRFPNGIRHDKGNIKQDLLTVKKRISNQTLEDWLVLNGAPDFETTAERYKRETGLEYQPISSDRAISGFTLNFIMMGATPGQRNQSLFKAACDLAQCGYSMEEAEQKLIEPSGLGYKEAYSCIKSAFKKINSKA